METKAYIDRITKWYVTKIFSAALPPTEASKVRVMTSQKYTSVPFLGTTRNFTKWYATEIFSAALLLTEAPKI